VRRCRNQNPPAALRFLVAKSRSRVSTVLSGLYGTLLTDCEIVRATSAIDTVDAARFERGTQSGKYGPELAINVKG